MNTDDKEFMMRFIGIIQILLSIVIGVYMLVITDSVLFGLIPVFISGVVYYVIAQKFTSEYFTDKKIQQKQYSESPI